MNDAFTLSSNSRLLKHYSILFFFSGKNELLYLSAYSIAFNALPLVSCKPLESENLAQELVHRRHQSTFAGPNGGKREKSHELFVGRTLWEDCGIQNALQIATRHLGKQNFARIKGMIFF